MYDSQAIGAGPLILVEMGKTAMLPICLTEGSSLNAEWYACDASATSVPSLLVAAKRT